MKKRYVADAGLVAIRAGLDKAISAEDVFGGLRDVDALSTCYRRLARDVHPDRFEMADPRDRDLAQELFVRLTTWKHEAERKLRNRTYGDGKPPLPPPPPPPAPQVIRTLRREYVVKERLCQGDIADLYLCSFEHDKVIQEAVFKVAMSPADNDLLENEAKVLGGLYPAKQPDEKFYRYLPKMLDTFTLRSPKATNRRVNILHHAKGYVSLAEVLGAYPNGLDYRDIVWMFKRTLAAIGFAHSQGVIHGALIPPHVLVHPTGHGAKVVDWCYAVTPGQKVKALSKPWRGYYAPEILGKDSATAATDIYMAAKCAVTLLGGRVETNELPPSVPRPLQGFLTSCLFAAPSKRPEDAWVLHEELDELLLRIIGKPKYRVLVMPTA